MSNQELEYGFYDSDDAKVTPTVWWYCFGLPFKTVEDAERTGKKSTWCQTVIVRRHPGATEFEVVES